MIVFANHAALTPAGKPDATPMPVAPVVVWVILVNAVLIHKVGLEEAAPTVLFAVTVMLAVPIINAGVHDPLTPLTVKL